MYDMNICGMMPTCRDTGQMESVSDRCMRYVACQGTYIGEWVRSG